MTARAPLWLPSHGFSQAVSCLAVLAAVSLTIIAAPFGAARAERTGLAQATTAGAEAFLSELNRRLPEQLERYGVPGVAVAIVRNGQVAWVEGYGVANLETREPVTAEMVFQAGSISKSLTAWGVMVLVERGEIDLDAPVERYLRRWELPPSPYATGEVTAARLLSHTSGLPFGIHGLPTSSEEVHAGRLDSALFGVEREPGAAFVYSNPGYVVLELLIEEVSGKRFADFMQEEVLDPLGMESSSFSLREDLAPRATTGHTFDGEPVSPDVQAPAAAGGLYTTASDLARFVAAATDGGPDEPVGRGILTPESVRRMHAPMAATEGLPHRLIAEGAGLGHFIETLPGGQRAVSHGGESEGWLGGYFAVPETGDGVVLLTNSRRSYHLMVQEVCAWAEWRDLGSLQITRSYDYLTSAVWAAIAVFTIGIGWLVWRLARGLRRGTRGFVPWTRQGWPWRLLQAGLAVALLWLWWDAGRAMLPTFLPVLSTYLAVALTVCAAFLLLTAAFNPHTRDQAKGDMSTM